MSDFSTTSIIDAIVDRRCVLVAAVIVVTVVLAFFIPHLVTDPTLKSGLDTNSQAYRDYERFVRIFGGEEFMLIAVKNPRPVDDPAVLTKLESMTDRLERVKHVEGVVSLTNLKVFRQNKGLFGSSTLIRGEPGGEKHIDRTDLEKIRVAVPSLDYLLSPDRKTFGVILLTDEKYGYDIPVVQKTVEEIHKIVRANLPVNAEYRIVGAPIVRLAIQRYNLQTAVVFGILCLLISTSVSFYIFKSIRVAAITLVVMVICVSWILAFMALVGISLNSTTGLSFGLVLIVSVAAIIRIVTHFNERYRHVQDREEAARQALRIVFFPCLMCSATTAVGFGSIMVTSIPMVFQLGVIMSLGVMLSFVLVVILTPAFLVVMPPLDPGTYERMAGDWVATVLAAIERAIFKYHRLCAVVGVVLTVAMAAGIPFIHSDTQILRMLSERTDEMKDLEFVEQNLGSIHSLELLIETDPNAFKKPEIWQKVRELNVELKALPEVVATDSFLPLLEYLNNLFQGSGDDAKSLFSNPGIIPELFAVVSLSPEGKKFVERYLDHQFGRLHISVRIKNSPSVPITETIEEVQSAAESVMGTAAKVTVTGDIAVFAAQASDLVRSQMYSLVIAFVLITALLMAHLRSVVLGLVSLIPNVLPVTVIFGIMGWVGISLDTVTVFCAAVALGLAVDDTVHFLKHLRYELESEGPDVTFQQCVHRSFEVTAKAMVSTSAVLFFGFIMLIISPFRPVVSFGILCSASILSALFGDVIMLPSVILSSSCIRRWIGKDMGRREDLEQARLP